MRSYVLILPCPDRKGIVAAVANFLFAHDCNIPESAQFGDSTNQQFFLRMNFEGTVETEDLASAFAPIGEKFAMRWQIYDSAIKSRVLIMVSKEGHCISDLLSKYRDGELSADIPAIVSNHADYEQLAQSYEIPFYFLPVEPGNKPQQEARLTQIVEGNKCDLIVLARYMQILSPGFVERYPGRILNIHHSFLPAFAGAKPYHQAHERGVKIIGATAHYVTADLDEGPIIEQGTARVEHKHSVADFMQAGREVERAVLTQAVKWHIEHRIVLNGRRTIVFK